MKKLMLELIMLAFSGTALLLISPVYAASVSRHDQTASGLSGWLVQDETIKIELNPLLKDQVRAFYLGRGFSEQLTERIAQSCVYQTVIQNVSDEGKNTLLDIDLSEWSIEGVDGLVQLIPKDRWIQEWAESGVSEASILAFRWATFPTQQHYELTGDYGWGMILFGAQPDDIFNLRAKWRVNGRSYEQLIEGLNCPG